jgi:hypothetical protein
MPQFIVHIHVSIDPIELEAINEEEAEELARQYIEKNPLNYFEYFVDEVERI